MRGDILFDSAAPENCSVNISVDSRTIDTGIDLRDNHLKKKEYLDADTYPTISFASQSITKQNGQWKVIGKLTIKNIAKEISFPFEAVQHKDGYIFKGTLPINRRDFGVGGGSFSLADEVVIKFDVKTN